MEYKNLLFAFLDSILSMDGIKYFLLFDLLYNLKNQGRPAFLAKGPRTNNWVSHSSFCCLFVIWKIADL